MAGVDAALAVEADFLGPLGVTAQDAGVVEFPGGGVDGGDVRGGGRVDEGRSGVVEGVPAQAAADGGGVVGGAEDDAAEPGRAHDRGESVEGLGAFDQRPDVGGVAVGVEHGGDEFDVAGDSTLGTTMRSGRAV